MDGPVTIDQVVKIAIAVSAGLGILLGPIMAIRWIMNGKARSNALEMTPGHAKCCRINREAIIRLQNPTNSRKEPR